MPRILIVDDSPTIRKMVLKFLRRHPSSRWMC